MIDCEALRATWPNQPVNAWSSLALVAAGILVATAGRGRQPARWLGASVAMAGVGSVLFHGDTTTATQWAHDASLLFLVAVLALNAGPWGPARPAAGVVALGASATLAALAPAATVGLVLLGAVVIVGGELAAAHLRDRTWLAVTAVLSVSGVAAHVLGRTDGPWCIPSSPLQPHAGWHVLAAASLVAYAAARGWIPHERQKRDRP